MLSNVLVLIIFKNKWLSSYQWIAAHLRGVLCTSRSLRYIWNMSVFSRQWPRNHLHKSFFLLYFICIFLPYQIHFCIGFMHLFGKGIILLSIANAGSDWLMSTRLTKVYEDMKGNTDLNWFVWTCWIFIHSSEDTDDHVTKTLRRKSLPHVQRQKCMLYALYQHL